MLFSNVGYFGNFFDAHTCKRYFIVAPVFKGQSSFPPDATLEHQIMMRVLHVPQYHLPSDQKLTLLPQSCRPSSLKLYWVSGQFLVMSDVSIKANLTRPRTMNISRRAPWVTYVVAVAFVLITIVGDSFLSALPILMSPQAEWFLNLWNRVREYTIHALSTPSL